MAIKPERILVVRNDKLGDFMLAFPCLALLRKALPGSRIDVLVPEYTREMAELCPSRPGIVVDPGPEAEPGAQRSLQRQLRNNRYDVVLTLHSTFRIGLLAWLAQIPLRIAPASKIAQIFYNERVIQRRSRSRQPEHAYNTDLGRHLIRLAGKTDFPEPTPPFLQFPSDEISQLRRAFAEGNRFDAEKPIVFIHAGHGGSANNLSLKQYAALAGQLRSTHGHHVVLTAGPSEESAVRKLSDLLKNTTHTVYVSREGLAQFARHIAFADVFVSGSTGPLHIAGALDVPTAAFYTRRRSATALRWQTLNSESRRLAFSPPDDAEVEDMSRVDIDAAAEKINRTYLADARNAVGGEPGFPPARE